MDQVKFVEYSFTTWSVLEDLDPYVHLITFYCQRMRKNRKTSPCSLKKWDFWHKVGALGGKYEFGLNFPNSIAPCLTVINAISVWCFWKDATKIIALPCSIWKLLQLQPLWNTFKFCHKGNFVKIMNVCMYVCIYFAD